MSKKTTCSKNCPTPVIMLPFPNNRVFIDNSINIIDKIDDSSNTYDHMGKYIVSSSSYYDNITKPFNAFNNDKTFWKSNNTENYYDFPSSDGDIRPYTTQPYTTQINSNISIYQGGSAPSSIETLNYYITNTISKSKPTVNGEWLQIQLPNPIVLTNYSIATPFDDKNNGLQYFPSKFTVVGSNDGTVWNYIDSSDNSITGSSNTPSINILNPNVTFSINNNTNGYSYYRLILESMQKNISCVRITQWQLTGYPYVSENFVGYINKQYSYYNFYPSLNSSSSFSISEPMSIIEDTKNNKNDTKKYNIYDYDYNKVYTGFIFTIITCSLVFIFVNK